MSEQQPDFTANARQALDEYHELATKSIQTAYVAGKVAGSEPQRFSSYDAVAAAERAGILVGIVIGIVISIVVVVAVIAIVPGF